jgi:hypothetical protein
MSSSPNSDLTFIKYAKCPSRVGRKSRPLLSKAASTQSKTVFRYYRGTSKYRRALCTSCKVAVPKGCMPNHLRSWHKGDEPPDNNQRSILALGVSDLYFPLSSVSPPSFVKTVSPPAASMRCATAQPQSWQTLHILTAKFGYCMCALVGSFR